MPILTKRQLLVAVGARAADLPPHEQVLYDAAKKEGAVT